MTLKRKGIFLSILLLSSVLVGCSESDVEMKYGTLVFENKQKQDTFLLGKTEDFKKKFNYELKDSDNKDSDSVYHAEEYTYSMKKGNIYLGVASSDNHKDYMDEIVYSIKLPKDAKSFSDKEVQDTINSDMKILEDLYNTVFEGNSEYYYKQTLKMMNSLKFDIDNGSSAMLEISDNYDKNTGYISVSYLDYGNEERIKISIVNDTINDVNIK